MANMGDELMDKFSDVLPALIARLKNEITSIVSTKTLATIANSRLAIHQHFGSVLPEVLETLASFLRKKNRVSFVLRKHMLNLL